VRPRRPPRVRCYNRRSLGGHFAKGGGEDHTAHTTRRVHAELGQRIRRDRRQLLGQTPTSPGRSIADGPVGGSTRLTLAGWMIGAAVQALNTAGAWNSHGQTRTKRFSGPRMAPTVGAAGRLPRRRSRAALNRLCFVERCAGINRHEGGDERVLHRRRSEPRWPRTMRRRS